MTKEIFFAEIFGRSAKFSTKKSTAEIPNFEEILCKNFPNSAFFFF